MISLCKVSFSDMCDLFIFNSNEQHLQVEAASGSNRCASTVTDVQFEALVIPSRAGNYCLLRIVYCLGIQLKY